MMFKKKPPLNALQLKIKDLETFLEHCHQLDGYAGYRGRLEEEIKNTFQPDYALLQRYLHNKLKPDEDEADMAAYYERLLVKLSNTVSAIHKNPTFYLSVYFKMDNLTLALLQKTTLPINSKNSLGYTFAVYFTQVNISKKNSLPKTAQFLFDKTNQPFTHERNDNGLFALIALEIFSNSSEKIAFVANQVNTDLFALNSQKQTPMNYALHALKAESPIIATLLKAYAKRFLEEADKTETTALPGLLQKYQNAGAALTPALVFEAGLEALKNDPSLDFMLAKLKYAIHLFIDGPENALGTFLQSTETQGFMQKLQTQWKWWEDYLAPSEAGTHTTRPLRLLSEKELKAPYSQNNLTHNDSEVVKIYNAL
jgi:hypothetical protein